MSEFRLRVNGRDSVAVASELEKELRRIWPDSNAGSAHERSVPGAQEITRTDPVAVATLAFTIPCGLLATVELADRMQVGEKVRRLVVWAKGKAITVERPDGSTEALEDADVGEWIDVAVEFESSEESASADSGAGRRP